MIKLVHPSDPILREVMPFFEGNFSMLRPVVAGMYPLMNEENGHGQVGIGLAAPQVGFRYRLFVMDLAQPERRKFAITARTCVNPSFEPIGDEQVNDTEGCLTWPGKNVQVLRYKGIRARWQNLNGVRKSRDMYDLAARVFQHELDHLNGKTIF